MQGLLRHDPTDEAGVTVVVVESGGGGGGGGGGTPAGSWVK